MEGALHGDMVESRILIRYAAKALTVCGVCLGRYHRK